MLFDENVVIKKLIEDFKMVSIGNCYENFSNGYEFCLTISDSVSQYKEYWDDNCNLDNNTRNFKFLIIDLIQIDEEYRNNKWGTKLMNVLINFAKIQGCSSVCLLVDNYNEHEFDLINWYSKFGFKMKGGDKDLMSWHVLSLK